MIAQDVASRVQPCLCIRDRTAMYILLQTARQAQYRSLVYRMRVGPSPQHRRSTRGCAGQCQGQSREQWPQTSRCHPASALCSAARDGSGALHQRLLLQLGRTPSAPFLQLPPHLRTHPHAHAHGKPAANAECAAELMAARLLMKRVQATKGRLLPSQMSLKHQRCAGPAQSSVIYQHMPPVSML